MFQCFKEKRTPSDDKSLKEKDTTFRWGTPQKARWGREKDSGAFSREGSPGHSLRSTDDDGGDDDSDDGGDDDSDDGGGDDDGDDDGAVYYEDDNYLESTTAQSITWPRML